MKVTCPKCGSDQLSANKKGFSAGKAIGGAVLTGGLGLLAGTHGSSKVICTCLACGNTFKAGAGKIIYEAGETPPATAAPAYDVEKRKKTNSKVLAVAAVVLLIIILVAALT